MSTTDYLEGAVWCLATFGAIAWGVRTILVRGLPNLAGVTRLVAATVLGYAGVVLAFGVPLTLGILGRGSVLLAALLVAAAPGLLLSSQRSVDPEPADGALDRTHSEDPISRGLGFLAITMVVAWLLAAASSVVFSRLSGQDVATFDIPLLARWMHTGSLWGTYEFQDLFSHGSYPHNGQLAMLSLVLPWHSDFAVRLMPYLALGLAAISAYGLSLELGATRSVALSGAAVLMAIPIVSISVIDFVMPDCLLLMATAAAAMFLVRHARTDQRSDLLLGGLALGLGVGTKWYGLSMGVVLIVVWAGARWAARVDVRQIVRQGLVLVGLAAAGGAMWFVRNLVEYGNPIFPQKVGVLGVTIFNAPHDIGRELAGASIAGRFGDFSDLRRTLLPTLGDTFAIGGILLALGLITLLGVALARPRRQGGAGVSGPVAAVAIAALGIFAAYLVTPFTAGPIGTTSLALANSRYAMPGLILAAAACGAAASQGARLRLAFQTLAVLAVIDGLRLAPDASAPRFVLCLVGLIALAAAVSRAPRRLPHPAAALALGLLIAVGAGYALERRNASSREKAADPTFAWIDAYAPTGHRVAVTGSWTQNDAPPQLAMLGPRLGNSIGLISRDDGHLLHPFGSRRAWTDAVETGHYDLLITGTADPRFVHWSTELAGSPVATSARFELFSLQTPAN